MAKLTPEMKEMLSNIHVAYLATADKTGKPNVVPVGTLKVVDDETLRVIVVYLRKTLKNLEENPMVSIVVADTERKFGYQFKGAVEILRSGPLYEEAAEERRKKGKSLQAVVKVRVDEIYLVKPGEGAGDRIR